MAITKELLRQIHHEVEQNNKRGVFALEGVLARVQQLTRAGIIRELPRETGIIRELPQNNGRVIIKVRIPEDIKVKINGKKENILDIQELADQRGVDVSTLIPCLPPGAVIRAWREERDLTASALCRATGMSDNYLSMLERRQSRLRNPELLTSISNALGITVGDIENGRLPDGVTIRFIPSKTLPESQA